MVQRIHNIINISEILVESFGILIVLFTLDPILMVAKIGKIQKLIRQQKAQLQLAMEENLQNKQNDCKYNNSNHMDYISMQSIQ